MASSETAVRPAGRLVADMRISSSAPLLPGNDACRPTTSHKVKFVTEGPKIPEQKLNGGPDPQFEWS